MMPTEKIERSLDLIATEMLTAKDPVVCSSFGKDSLVVLDLVYQIRQRVPILFFPQHAKQFPEKYQFARDFIAAYKLPVWSLPPRLVTHVQDGDYFEIFTQFGGDATGPLNMSLGCRAWQGTDKEFVCAAEMLLQPPNAHVNFPWDLTFIGTKACDPIPLAGTVENFQSVIDSGSTRICLPLADWTDDDIWAYIKAREIPYSEARYDEQLESADPDRYPVCFGCLDTRKRGEKVFCPVLESMIPNRAMPEPWHAQQKLKLLQAVGYASFRLGKPVDPALEKKFLPQEEQWPLWSVKKRVYDEKVYAHIQDLVDISKAPNGFARLRDEWIRLERRCGEAGIIGWIASVARDNVRMQRCMVATGAEFYAEDADWYYVKKMVDPTQLIFPTVREMAARVRAQEEQTHA
jgi:Phosphoadenosine phosphosulfate reductase family